MERDRHVLKQHILAYGVVLLLLTVAAVAAPRVDHTGTPSLHTLAESLAAVIALLAGAIAIVRYQARRDLPYLFIGVGLLGSGAFDAFHAWSSSVYAYRLFPSGLTTLTIWGWAAGRLYLGAMLVLAGWAWWWGEGDREGRAAVRAGEVYLVSLGIGALVFALFLLVDLPPALFPDAAVPRPHEFVAGLLYVAALGGFFAMGRWRREPAEHWLVQSLIVALAIQIFVIPFSDALWDARYDFAHVLKIVSYGLVFIGLVVNVHSLHTTVVEEERRLVDTNRRLEQEVVLRSQAESAAAGEKHLLESVFEGISDGVLVVEADGRTARFNSAAQELFGFTPGSHQDASERIGLYGLFRSDERTPLRPDELPSVRAMEGEEVVDARIFTRNPRRPEGAHLSVAAQPLRNGDGRVIGSVVVMRDITTEHRVQEQLRRYTSELERRNQDLQDFATIVSHDLKEPLRKVLAFGERLETRIGEDSSPEARDYLRRMRQGAERMRNLVDDLLAYTRLGEKDHLEEVDLKDIAERARADLEERIGELGAQVDVGDIGRVECDPVQMYHVFVNLIGNGLKYHRDGVRPRVAVRGQIQDGTCTVRVEDNGIGFEMKYAERIFRPFHRLHTRSEYEGSGIGLAIVRKVVEHHGGKIDVASVPDQGTTFVVRLPVRQQVLEVETPAAH